MKIRWFAFRNAPYHDFFSIYTGVPIPSFLQLPVMDKFEFEFTNTERNFSPYECPQAGGFHALFHVAVVQD